MTSWKCLEAVFARCLQDILKALWRRLSKTAWRCLENVLEKSWKRSEEVLKMSSRRFCKTSWRHLGKKSWKCLEDAWPRRIYWSWSRRLEGVLKISSEDVWVRWMYSSWSRRFHQDECLLGIWSPIGLLLLPENVLKTSWDQN